MKRDSVVGPSSARLTRSLHRRSVSLITVLSNGRGCPARLDAARFGAIGECGAQPTSQEPVLASLSATRSHAQSGAGSHEHQTRGASAARALKCAKGGALRSWC